jgi:hypothetical protein
VTIHLQLPRVISAHDFFRRFGARVVGTLLGFGRCVLGALQQLCGVPPPRFPGTRRVPRFFSVGFGASDLALQVFNRCLSFIDQPVVVVFSFAECLLNSRQ